MNARCGNLLDYSEYDLYEIDIVEDVCTSIVEPNVKQRNSEDTKINHYGRRLIDLCTANDLLIVNGRSVSDPTGSCTCYMYNGSSVVDYVHVLCSKQLIDCIDLKVDDINPLSDHCIIRTFLSVPTPGLGSSTVDQVLKYTKYPKYIPSTSTGQVLIFLKST